MASTATAWRVVEQVAGDELGLAGIRAARAHARGRAWTAGAYPDADLLVVDVDGTLLDAHSDKQAQPAPTSTATASTRWWPSWIGVLAPVRP